MEFTKTDIPDVKIVRLRATVDHRGSFSETYRRDLFIDNGIHDAFVQDNQSYSVHEGTVRGLHYQVPPHQQAKLVRVLRGAVLDVAVDIRKASPSFGKHVAIELSADNGLALYIPAGFAHGFMTLSRHAEVSYKVSDYYAPDHDRGVLWSDPDLAISWPHMEKPPILSHRDRHLPLLRDCPLVF